MSCLYHKTHNSAIFCHISPGLDVLEESLLFMFQLRVYNRVLTEPDILNLC